MIDTRTQDRLIEDEARRRQGAFFTPTLWVNEAHKMISGALGENWKKECIVWDPAAGTGNLTRDYEFSDLIISTVEKSDVEVIRGQSYNPGASIFNYDFLNDDDSPFFEGKNVIPPEVSSKLEEAASEGKRLVFFMNPPYGEHSIAGTTGESREGMAKTGVNAVMLETKLGLASRQLYAQFLFRCKDIAKTYGFEDYTIAVFSKNTFMTSGSYKPFRNWWYSSHEYLSGMLFQASHFADVSGRWGIAFTIWNSGGKTDSEKIIDIELKDTENFKVCSKGSKAVYNSDDREASKWVREPLGKVKGIDAPQMTSGLKVKEGSDKTILTKALFNFNCHSNNIMKSGTDSYFTSSCSTGNAGVSVLPSNFNCAIALYSARKLILGDWVNDKDEYLIPNEADPDYLQWVKDCQVYSILHISNNCTSMRKVQYKGKSWNIFNHFFWKTHAETLAALDTPKTTALYRDCRSNPSKDVFGNTVESSPNPYMSLQLDGLGAEAQEVLNQLNALWEKSLPLREAYSAEHPELHLESWDCGAYQLKHLWRDIFPEDWKELQKAHRALAEKLRPGVYKFGFLK